MKKLLLILTLLLVPTGLFAQGNNCAPRELLVQRLYEVYKEALHFIGVQADGRVVEFFLNEEEGNFTVVISRPSGISCFVSSGDTALRFTPPKIPMIEEGEEG